MKTLYILGTDKNGMGKGDGLYSLIADDGEFMASHLCSHEGYARSDLHDRREERKTEYKKRFGEYEVKWLGDDDMKLETLQERNKEWGMKEAKYHIEVTYQPINKTWGANIKKGNLIANEVDEDLKVALNNLADTILLTEALSTNAFTPKGNKDGGDY